MNTQDHGTAMRELAQDYCVALMNYNICKQTNQNERAEMNYSSMVSLLNAMNYHAELVAEELVNHKPVTV